MLDRGTAEIVLPSGRAFCLERTRWEGKLEKEEIDFCRAHGIEIGFDPVQQGWVILEDEDDCDAPRPAVVRAHAMHAQVDAAPSYSFRAWGTKDIGAYMALLDDPAVWTYIPEAYPGHIDADTAHALIEISNSGAHHDVCAIVRDGEIIGQARLAFPEGIRDFDVAEISYWIGRKHWGKGYGSEVVRLFTDRSFSKFTSLREIRASVHEDNIASARVLEKSGYRHVESAGEREELRILSLCRPAAFEADNADRSPRLAPERGSRLAERADAPGFAA